MESNTQNLELIEIAKTSDALKWRSDKEGTFAYPSHFEGKVPLKVRMDKTVNSEFFFIQPPISAYYSNEYYVKVNSYGAVTAIIDSETQLGLKPDEFTVTEWHK